MLRTTFAILFLAIFAIPAMSQDEEPTKILLVPAEDSLRSVSYTLDMLSVVNNKCLGCHSPTGRNEKARKKFQWEKVQMMEGMDAYAAMDEILEVLEEGSMPPEKMLERYPQMKLTEEETATLKKWAEATLAKMEE